MTPRCRLCVHKQTRLCVLQCCYALRPRCLLPITMCVKEHSFAFVGRADVESRSKVPPRIWFVFSSLIITSRFTAMYAVLHLTT